MIYPTLVNLGQHWKTRCLLIDKQGNFGSIEGDPPAAMRYTEARMTAAAVAMLEDIKFETVDFKANYDERLMEPTVLPAKFPCLLVNGSSGIAVGMASSHAAAQSGRDLRRHRQACWTTRDRSPPELSRSCRDRTSPPAAIIGRRGIAQAYSTGRGRIMVRGKVRQEERKGPRRPHHRGDPLPGGPIAT